MASKQKHILALFDVDGTLTIPRGEITKDMEEFMFQLKGKITTGVVGGSDLPKQKEQLGAKTFEMFNYNFAQNGLEAFKEGKTLGENSISAQLGEDNLQRIINWVLTYFGNLTLPIKRGTFIEFRTGMLNVSPIGRNCSREERNEFEKYDIANNIRKNMIDAMKVEFADLKLTFSVGGQISFDIFPEGWDKTYCLQFFPENEFTEVHFFGDKTFPGGNDHEIYEHPRTVGHTVTSPEDTRRICEELWGK